MPRIIVEIGDEGCHHPYVTPYGDGSFGKCKVCGITELPLVAAAELDSRLVRYQTALVAIASRGCTATSGDRRLARDGEPWCWRNLHAPPYCSSCTAAMALATMCEICGKPMEDADIDDGAHSWCVRAKTDAI